MEQEQTEAAEQKPAEIIEQESSEVAEQKSAEIVPLEQTTVVEQPEQEVLQGYTAAIRSVLQHKGKAPFTLSGLKTYETLAQIDASITNCLSERDHPLLQKIQTITRRRHQEDERYEQIKRQQSLILAVAEVLDAPTTSQNQCIKTGAEVAQELDELLTSFETLVDFYPEDASIIEHIIRRSQAWMPGLFVCYEEPASPRTNTCTEPSRSNDLEQYIGHLKHQRRRMTGRKDVADYIVRHGPYVTFHDSEEPASKVLERFQQVNSDDLRQELEHWRTAQTGSRLVRSFRRNSQDYLGRLEQLWFDYDGY